MIAARAEHASALDRDDAADLDQCATAFEQMGAPLYAAESAAAASAAHRRAGHGRHADRSALHARSLAARCEHAQTPALALAGATAVLTPSEREVAALAAAGQSSKAIAERLFVSPRTVESQLHRAYEKLGVSSRAELADCAGRRQSVVTTDDCERPMCSLGTSRPSEWIPTLPDLDHVMARLAADPAFAAALADEPTATLAGYDLSADDLAAIAERLDGDHAGRARRRPRCAHRL